MKITNTIKLVIVLFFFSFSITAQDISFNMEVKAPKSKDLIVMKVITSGSKICMEPQFATDQGSMKIIVDSEANKQYMLMENNGQKMAMSVDPFDVEKTVEKAKDPKITITKETRTIDGFKCKKVIAETDEVISDIWLTQEAGFSYNELYKIFNSSKGTPGARNSLPALTNVKGFPIEIVSKDKSKNENVVVNIRNISRAKVDQSVFSMDGYKVVDMRKMRQ